MRTSLRPDPRERPARSPEMEGLAGTRAGGRRGAGTAAGTQQCQAPSSRNTELAADFNFLLLLGSDSSRKQPRKKAHAGYQEGPLLHVAPSLLPAPEGFGDQICTRGWPFLLGLRGLNTIKPPSSDRVTHAGLLPCLLPWGQTLQRTTKGRVSMTKTPNVSPTTNGIRWAWALWETPTWPAPSYPFLLIVPARAQGVILII